MAPAVSDGMRAAATAEVDRRVGSPNRQRSVGEGTHEHEWRLDPETATGFPVDAHEQRAPAANVEIHIWVVTVRGKGVEPGRRTITQETNITGSDVDFLAKLILREGDDIQTRFVEQCVVRRPGYANRGPVGALIEKATDRRIPLERGSRNGIHCRIFQQGKTR